MEAIAHLVDDEALSLEEVWLHALAEDDGGLGQEQMDDEGQCQCRQDDLHRILAAGCARSMEVADDVSPLSTASRADCRRTFVVRHRCSIAVI